MNRCIVFDLDGTLIDSIADIALATNRMREHYGLVPLPDKTVVGYVGHGIAQLAALAVADAPHIAPEEATEEVLRAYRNDPVVHTTLYPGAADGLRILKTAGFRLATASNKPDVLCVPILKKLGVLNLFDAVIGGGRSIAMKPAPDMLLYAFKETGAEPARSWMFGDSEPDMTSGRAAGCRTAYAAYGYGKPAEGSWNFKANSFLEFVYHALKNR